VGLYFAGIYYFYSFLSVRDLRAPLADRPETLPHDGKYVQFNNPDLKI